jgi:hypothetical protein
MNVSINEDKDNVFSMKKESGISFHLVRHPRIYCFHGKLQIRSAGNMDGLS